MRLALAACLALGAHVLLLRVEMPWSRPSLMVPVHRTVSIDLVTFESRVKKPSPPKPQPVQPGPRVQPGPPPKPAPKPAAKPLAKPVPKSVMHPRPAPRPAPAAPLAEVFETAAVAAPADEEPAGASPAVAPEVDVPPADKADDRAAVQASVPLYDRNPPPRYPRAARKRNYQGTVVLDVRVTAGGSVAEVRIAASSGYAILDRSAAKSVKGWRFSPALKAGRPIEMWVKVPVRFELR